ncbi:hypothetical protein N7532_003550 [Penicillium argentinense]|uniref:Uncharacterized protein n=1 Tax=Penicillium argentinense TaxID=1131581 RepID=A0A9W9KEM6_9EURO|nr:uncharacterized protein N7532_003550 [Penicillium argentinense]KAJ5103021.1 hypothetical protein N7532_003550 [Penicillium argentinense]
MRPTYIRWVSAGLSLPPSSVLLHILFSLTLGFGGDPATILTRSFSASSSFRLPDNQKLSSPPSGHLPLGGNDDAKQQRIPCWPCLAAPDPKNADRTRFLCAKNQSDPEGQRRGGARSAQLRSSPNMNGRILQQSSISSPVIDPTASGIQAVRLECS